MASIYESAFLTIAALSAPDGETPFLSNRTKTFGTDKSLNVRYGTTIIRLRARPILPVGLHRDERAAATDPLEKIAWALQELQLPRRVALFTGVELQWRCIEMKQRECTRFPHRPRNYHGNFESLHDAYSILQILHRQRIFPVIERLKQWAFKYWLCTVEQYTKRSLTYGMDKLPALTGLASRVYTVVQSEYLAGVWRDDVIEELCWRHAATHEGGIAYQLDGNSTPIAPSFSWASIPGPVVFLEDGSRCNTNLFQTEPPCVFANLVDAKCTTNPLNQFGEAPTGSLTLDIPIVDGRLSCSTPANIYSYELRIGARMAKAQMVADTILAPVTFSTDLSIRYAKRSNPGSSAELKAWENLEVTIALLRLFQSLRVTNLV